MWLLLLSACTGPDTDLDPGPDTDTEPEPVPWSDDACADISGDSLFDGVIDEFADEPADSGLVVVGSSSIRRWETAFSALSPWGPVIQRGFGGGLLRDVALRADDLILRHDPHGVVVFAGTNDLAIGRGQDDVVDAFRCLVQQTGNTPIVFVGITPTPARWSGWDEAAATNEAIRAWTEQRDHWHYADVPGAFLPFGSPPQDSLFDPDRLHLSESGYALFSAAIEDALAGAVAERPAVSGGGFDGYIRVDLGPANAEDGAPAPAIDSFGIHWNAWPDAAGGQPVLAGFTLPDLVTTTGESTAVGLVITGGFRSNGLQNGGLTDPDLDTLSVVQATQDFFWTETADDPGALSLVGLDPARRYRLRLFASRATDQVRVTRYTATGANTATTTLNTTGNTSTVAVLDDLRPDAWGQIHLDVAREEGAYAYLSLLELEAL